MDRRAFLSTVALLVALRAFEAQPASSVCRVGFLAGSSPTSSWHAGQAFQQGLHEFGRVDGHNIVVDHRFAEDRYERPSDLAADVVRLKVEGIAALGNAESPAATAFHDMQRRHPPVGPE